VTFQPQTITNDVIEQFEVDLLHEAYTVIDQFFGQPLINNLFILSLVTADLEYADLSGGRMS
jgi:hypothetical protein